LVYFIFPSTVIFKGAFLARLPPVFRRVIADASPKVVPLQWSGMLFSKCSKKGLIYEEEYWAQL
jgi:hypothetical protein